MDKLIFLVEDVEVEVEDDSSFVSIFILSFSSLLRHYSVFQDLSGSESVIPEEYHIVQNKGLQSLELYEEWVCPTMRLYWQSAF